MLHQSLRDGNVGLDWKDVLVGIVEQDPRGRAGVFLPARHVALEAVVQGSHLVRQAEMLGIRRAEHERKTGRE